MRVTTPLPGSPRDCCGVVCQLPWVNPWLVGGTPAWYGCLLGSLKALGNAQSAYEAPRQRANGAMLAALDGLKRVFEPQTGLLSGLRGLGLDAINALPGAKQRIVRYAMGL